MEIVLFIGRILFGGYFVMNGLNHFVKFGMMRGYAASKQVPAAGLAVVVTGLLLIFGGAGMLSGGYIDWAVPSLVIFLVPVSFKMHNFWSITDPQMKMVEMVNFLKNMALLGATLMMLAIPKPWPFGFALNYLQI